MPLTRLDMTAIKMHMYTQHKGKQDRGFTKKKCQRPTIVIENRVHLIAKFSMSTSLYTQKDLEESFTYRLRRLHVCCTFKISSTVHRPSRIIDSFIFWTGRYKCTEILEVVKRNIKGTQETTFQ